MTHDDLPGLERIRQGLAEGLSMMPYESFTRGCLSPLLLEIESTIAAGRCLDDTADDETESMPPHPKVDRRARWGSLPRAEREALVLEALGDDEMLAREVAERVADTLGLDLYDGHVRPVMEHMRAAGRITRSAESRGGNAIRYRYFRLRPLDGPIADLERAFQDVRDERDS